MKLDTFIKSGLTTLSALPLAFMPAFSARADVQINDLLTDEPIVQDTYSQYGGFLTVEEGINFYKLERDLQGYRASLGGGAVYNLGTINKISATFIDNGVISSESALGGAIFNMGMIDEIVNANFIDNFAISDKVDSAFGGAIYSISNLNIAADGADSIFSGNYTQNAGEKVQNAIYMADANATLSLNARNSGNIVFDDSIEGAMGYTLSLDADSDSSISLNNDIINAHLVMGSATDMDDFNVYISNTSNIAQVASLTQNAGTLHLNNYGITQLYLPQLNLNGGKMKISGLVADLQNATMGTLNADSISGNGTAVVVGTITVSTDSLTDSTTLSFTDSASLAGMVSSDSNTAYGPIYKYTVNYDDSVGDFSFTKAFDDVNGNVDEGYNPDVLVGSVNTLAALQIANSEINQRVLSDADAPQQASGYSKAVENMFVKAFTSKDSIDISGFSEISARFSGAIVGLQSDAYKYGYDSTGVANIYGAYVNNTVDFADSKVKQQSYYLGSSFNYRRGDFFMGNTINAGLTKNKEESADSNSIHFDSYSLGIASKLGYDIDVADDWVVQPNLFVSFIYLKSDNYATNMGADIDMPDMSLLQMAPGVKVVKHIDDDTSAHVEAKYITSQSYADAPTANDIALPQAELSDYMEYGVGVSQNTPESRLSFVVRHRNGAYQGWSADFLMMYKF